MFKFQECHHIVEYIKTSDIFHNQVKISKNKSIEEVNSEWVSLNDQLNLLCTFTYFPRVLALNNLQNK